jgi:hypothetical protein
MDWRCGLRRIARRPEFKPQSHWGGKKKVMLDPGQKRILGKTKKI